MSLLLHSGKMAKTIVLVNGLEERGLLLWQTSVRFTLAYDF